MLQEVVVDVRAELRAICRKAGLDPKEVFAINATPRTITFSRYALENGKAVYDKENDSVKQLLPLTFGIK